MIYHTTVVLTLETRHLAVSVGLVAVVAGSTVLQLHTSVLVGGVDKPLLVLLGNAVTRRFRVVCGAGCNNHQYLLELRL